MTQISGMDEKKVAEITMITGCLAIITCILIAVMMTLVYSQIKNWDEGILVVITITGIAAGGVALVLYPVISRCKSRQVFMALAILVPLPTLLLASDFFRTSGFNEIPWGSWTLIILFCGVTTLFVSQIPSYFRQPLGNLRPVYHVTFLSMGVMILAAGSGAITEILGKMVTGNLFPCTLR